MEPGPDAMDTAYETVETDVLVIGAGGAGLRGAIAAAESGCRVTMICKSLLGKAHTVMAEGGMAAALGNVAGQDSWEAHFADTMKGGKLLNNWRMAEIHAQEAPDRVLELERWGRSSTAPIRASSTSGPSEPTPIPGWRTSEIGPAWS